jgi:DNA-binding PadR family transcriptional regulator
MTRERTHHSRHQEPADSLREAAGRFHHHVRERLERGGRDRHRGGWSPFDHGRRAARGDVRAAILVLLAEKQSHGYQIIQELERRSEGAWRASPGSVYPTLQQLEDEGLVRAVEADGGRRVFELTDTGKEEAAKLAAGPAPWADAAGSVGGDHRDLREQVFQLLAATAQVGRSGDAAHIAEARKILHEARRKLYLLLAGNESPSEKTEG